MTPVHAFHLPPAMTPGAVHLVQHGPIAMKVPTVDRSFYLALLERLRTAHASLASTLTDHNVIALLAEAACRWRNPDYPFRRLALSTLPALTGYAPAMIEEGLDHRLAQLTPERLARLIDEAADRLAGHNRPLQGPPLILLVVAGHIPGLAIDDVAGLLLAKSAGLIRPSGRDPLIPALFVRTLAEIDPRIGELLAVAWWPRAADAVTAAVGGAVDLVVASGNDDTIAHLARSASHPHQKDIIGYGHRRSVALISADGMTAHTAEQLARDVCWYEQQGCLSPHLVYVEEHGSITPRGFAELMASALRRMAHHWPPSVIPIASAAATLQLRAEVEFREAAGTGLFTPFPSPDRLAGGTVLYDPDPSPRPSPGYRTLWVKPAARLEQALDALAPWRDRIESIGLALSDERRAELHPLIERLGPSRTTPIGTMQEPSLRWRLLDQALLTRLVGWTETPSIARL